MGDPVLCLYGSIGGDERLPDDLAAEDPLPAILRAAATEQIALKLFEIESSKKFFDGGYHQCLQRFLEVTRLCGGMSSSGCGV
jgi:hypothetical protein